ncbi:DEAD/DEAH box helicase [Paraburkholderia phenoliruptrix]|uniref:ATP-dependent RNA helicase RhlE n=2 Tax=Paraburkholderia phenoliruptrix TaxID=252970 RepID=A0A6J5K6M5_9BURK|nr:DEAD/DEAH box helicase [Paraburkholderia phenoliruptrix]AFT87056.1 ATP-dependent RNA helicase RhlE [Paraburkholderia phenoliruptrix BR3459a]MDR6389847.1 ATP-dependent RNA helicase RhlE [Paraburkholderia phenoliruptrix]CAB4049368.1 ATP-dependent RNA helicase RhlE [Paraburkholderia phenoliruptrix]
MSFDSLGLSEPLVRAVHELGYTTPTPIQTQAIPAVLNGGDLLAGAQTGTGKTAGFTLPILQRLHSMPPLAAASGKRAVRALILTPTRELAAQVEESVRAYGKYLKLKSTVMFGGVGINPQIGALKSGVDIVVATPGRLLDHMQQKTIDLSHLEILVLDEADRMLDMGFIHDIKRVLAKLPPKRQNLLFSATFSDEIKALADNLLDSPALIEVARRNTTAETVAQKIHPVDRDKKRELLTHLIKQHNWFQVLVFTRTKHGANRLAEQLTKDGISALAIHGNKSQSARTRALAEFKDGTLQVLVATDIAARGIDIDQLPHVVNFDLPNVPEDYVHRIGRTGRAGATGEAVSLVCVDELQLLKDIEKLIKRPVPQEVIAGFEPDPTAKPEPILRRGQGGGGRSPRQGQGQGAPNGGNGGAARGARGSSQGANQGTAQGTAQRSGQRPTNGQQQPKPQAAKPQGAKPAGNGGQPRRDGQRHDDRPRAIAHEGGVAHAPRKPQGSNPGALLGGGAKPRTDAPRGAHPARSGQRGR